MGFEALLAQTVTVVRYSDGTRNAHGNPARVESSRADVPARLEQVATREEGATRDAVTDRWRLFVAAGTALDAGDEVLHDGRRFTVDGTPGQVQGRSGTHHVEALLRYEGGVT